MITNLGNVAGVVRSILPPLEEDGTTVKTYVLWAQPIGEVDEDGIPLGGTYTVHYYNTTINNWLSLDSSPVFKEDLPYNFSPGNSLGKLKGSGTYPSSGLTYEQFIREISVEYIAPVFTSFNIQSEPTVVEVGTTISGSKTFKWGITLNNGVVPTIDIYDNTAEALLANTPNNGTKEQAITSIVLGEREDKQSWKGIAKVTDKPDISSSNFVITALYNRYWGAVASLPTDPNDSTANRIYANALPYKNIKTNGVNTFTLDTGTLYNKYIVLLEPGVTITSVIDTGNLNLDITDRYILSTIKIKDAAGVERNFNQYLYNPALVASTSSNHVIKTT